MTIGPIPTPILALTGLAPIRVIPQMKWVLPAKILESDA